MDYFPKPYVISMLEPVCPNMSSREGWVIDMITLHFSKGLGAKGTAKWGKDPRASGAAQFYADRLGPIYQAAPLNMRAWHHGRSVVEYQGKTYRSKTDRCSVGIEMANCGHMIKGDDGHFYFTFGENPRKYPRKKYGEPQKAALVFNNGKMATYWWEPYPQPLVDSVTRLVVDLVKAFDVPVQRIVGHEDVAIPLGNRKFDPGPLWNWRAFISRVCDELGVPVPDDVWKLHKTVG